MATLSDRDIVTGYLEGRPEACRMVDRWIHAVVRNRHWGLNSEHEDIVQDTRKRVFENLVRGKFRGRSSLKTYVIQIAKYVCIEFLRRKIRTRAEDIDGLELEDGAPSPERTLEEKEREQIAAEALSQLPDGCRELFEMIFRECLPYEEIARRLGVAPGTVKSRASRCRALLGKYMKKYKVGAAQFGGNRGTERSTN